MAEQEWCVAKLADIEDPGAVEFTTGAGDWPFRGVLVHWQGQVHAYANACAHLGHPLNLAPDSFLTRDKALLLCSSHGAVFEPDTGLCIGGPCAGASLRCLACRVADGQVFVVAPDSMHG